VARFDKPKDKTIITRKQANVIKKNAENARKSGTPNDMIIARSADELLDRCTIIDEN
jgi:hypothetical protein